MARDDVKVHVRHRLPSSGSCLASKTWPNGNSSKWPNGNQFLGNRILHSVHSACLDDRRVRAGSWAPTLRHTRIDSTQTQHHIRIANRHNTGGSQMDHRQILLRIHTPCLLRTINAWSVLLPVRQQWPHSRRLHVVCTRTVLKADGCGCAFVCGANNLGHLLHQPAAPPSIRDAAAAGKQPPQYFFNMLSCAVLCCAVLCCAVLRMPFGASPPSRTAYNVVRSTTRALRRCAHHATRIV